MKRHMAGWVAKAILGGAVVLLGASHAAAQTTGARTGGGGAGGGGAGTSGFGTAGNTGGGNTGGTPLSQGGTGGRTGTGGTTSNTAAPSPTTSNSFNTFYSSVLAPGAGINKTLSSGNFSSSTSSSGSGSSGSSTSGISSSFASGFTSGGTIQTIKQNSFTQPVFAVTTTTTTGTTGTTTTAGGFSTYGTPRAPSYVTTIGFDTPRTLIAPTAIQADLRRMLDGSSSLNGRAVQIAVNGGTVVLRGLLPTERQRRVAEAMVRLTPGVREVRNEIQVPPEAVPPSQ